MAEREGSPPDSLRVAGAALRAAERGARLPAAVVVRVWGCAGRLSCGETCHPTGILSILIARRPHGHSFAPTLGCEGTGLQARARPRSGDPGN